jgi:serine protease Do
MNSLKKSGSQLVVMALVVAAVSGLTQLVPGSRAEAAPAADAAGAVDVGLAPVVERASFADVIAAVKPAVVNISSASPAGPARHAPGPGRPLPDGRFGQAPPSMEDFFRRFFERQSFTPSQAGAPEARSMGSGFIVDPEGLVVTNNHVIDGATEILVTLNDGSRFPAEIVGRDAKTDLALLSIETDEPLPFASLGDSDAARVGDWVIAIGNPFGLGGTATTGIVSARGRDIQAGPYDDFLQIDAPINRGNSGGPLFDSAGRVIGVNTAIFSPNGGSVGIGFAIPASQVAPVVEQLRESGHVERGWLGVQIQTLDDELAAGMGREKAGGALVASVVEDSPAERAGLRPGDVILSFENEEITDVKSLTRRVAAAGPSSEIELEVWRGGKTVEIELDLGESPDDIASQARREMGEGEVGDGLGLSLMPLTPQNRQRFGVDEDLDGALVAQVDPTAPAAKKGLRPGDVILGVGQEPVSGPAEVIEQVERLRRDDRSSVVFQIARGGDRRFLAVPLA